MHPCELIFSSTQKDGFAVPLGIKLYLVGCVFLLMHLSDISWLLPFNQLVQEELHTIPRPKAAHMPAEKGECMSGRWSCSCDRQLIWLSGACPIIFRGVVVYAKADDGRYGAVQTWVCNMGSSS
jgi:hypothetical protein